MTASLDMQRARGLLYKRDVLIALPILVLVVPTLVLGDFIELAQSITTASLDPAETSK